MHSHPDYDVYFADGINAFNSVSSTATLLQVKEVYAEVFSFFFQFYADTSQLWRTIDPSHISSIDSDEDFQLLFIVLASSPSSNNCSNSS